MLHYVYGLHLKGDNEVRYVGSTHDLQKRFWQHLNEFKKRDGDKNEWVKANRAAVCIKVLETTEGDYKDIERRWIIKLRKEGHRLFNIRRPRRSTRKERQAVVIQWLDLVDKPPF